MFQSRTYTFPFKNIGNATIECSWSLDSSDEYEDEEIPFTVIPQKCTLTVGETTMITVKFAPMDLLESITAKERFHICMYVLFHTIDF